MSRRISTQTKITDRAIAIEALKIAGHTYREDGNTIHITSGDLNRCMLDLSTGTVSGDSDFRTHSEARMRLLNVAYAEAICRRQCNLSGAQIESREVQKNGEVLLVCRSA